MKLDLARSWIVGDRAHDLAAGAAAGLAGGTLLAGTKSPNGRPPPGLLARDFVVETAPNLADAVAALIGRRHFGDRAE